MTLGKEVAGWSSALYPALWLQTHSIIRVGRNIQRLLFFRIAADSTFPAHRTQRWEGYAYHDPPILRKVQNSGGVLCAGRPNARSGRVGLDFFAQLFSSRKKVEKIKSEGTLRTKNL